MVHFHLETASFLFEQRHLDLMSLVSTYEKDVWRTGRRNLS